jgi:PAS domain S-box-containing protein
MREKEAIAPASSQFCARPQMKSAVQHRSLVLCVLVFIAFAHLSFAADTSTHKTVLVLFSFTDFEDQDDLEILESTTRSHVASPVDFHVEYLGSTRFDAPGYEKATSASLASVYGGKKIDLVVAVFYPALRFALEHRGELFPGAPIVFSTIPTERLEGQKLGPGVTGVTMNFDVKGTIDLALRLEPDAKNAAIVVGASEPDRFGLSVINQEFRAHESKLNVIDLPGLQTDELLKRVAALPPRTLVFFEMIPQWSAQPVVRAFDLVSLIAGKFQTYCFVKRCLGHGVIGGSYPSGVEQSMAAGRLAARVLSGEKPEDIPIIHGPPALTHVDWRQLQRWHISESALPPGTIISYRQPTRWERYRKYVIAGLILVIVGLLLRRAWKQKSERKLLESEKRFRLMADTTPAWVWMCDAEGNTTYLNHRWDEFTGRDPTADLGEVWLAFVHPDELQNFLTASALAIKQQGGFSREYRLRRLDGVYRWMLDIAAPRMNGDGSFAGFIGSAVDTTDQKLAREALEKIGGKLIQAQEEERSRIARELHDDICQRLALLSMELEQVNRGSNGSSGSVNPRIETIRRHCAEIAGDVQALSHKLHSSKLEYLGVAAAISSFCREFSQQNDVNIQFAEENVPTFLPRDISLSLFRVAQEALQNALKYSGVRQFSVRLRATADEIQLNVSDEGKGFDVHTALREKGLGLVSMQERVHLVHGILTISSTDNRGTTILARVPFVPEPQTPATGAESERLSL